MGISGAPSAGASAPPLKDLMRYAKNFSCIRMSRNDFVNGPA